MMSFPKYLGVFRSWEVLREKKIKEIDFPMFDCPLKNKENQIKICRNLHIVKLCNIYTYELK